MVHIAATAASAPGAGYRQNDDRMLLMAGYDVYAVADGTGAYGRIADLLLAGIEAHLAQHGRPRSIDDLEAAVRSGETALAAAVAADPKIRGAGTTLDIVAFTEEPALLAIHVGDGRVYHMRGGAAAQLSVDHTWVQQEMSAGRLQPSDARTHMFRNVITRAFLGAMPVELDKLQHPLEPGDRIILCTDGVWKTFDESYFLDVAARSPALDEIVKGCVDNATVVVLQVGRPPSATADI